MRVGVWLTGHDIADTVARNALRGMPDARIFRTYEEPGNYQARIEQADCHIAYGILRGAADIFKMCSAGGIPWFNVDRGYINPGHYDGYYRVSLRGTQYCDDHNIPTVCDRLQKLKVNFAPWRGFDFNRPVLICPPTDYVKGFFSDIDDHKWRERAVSWLLKNEITKYIIREKTDSMQTAEPQMHESNFALTFNCSLGWKAIRDGIPCVSDPHHSFIGSRYKNIPLDELSERQKTDQVRAFGAMSELQLTLQEMREGRLWPLMSRMLSTSAGTAEKR